MIRHIILKRRRISQMLSNLPLLFAAKLMRRRVHKTIAKMIMYSHFQRRN